MALAPGAKGFCHVDCKFISEEKGWACEKNIKCYDQNKYIHVALYNSGSDSTKVINIPLQEGVSINQKADPIEFTKGGKTIKDLNDAAISGGLLPNQYAITVSRDHKLSIFLKDAKGAFNIGKQISNNVGVLQSQVAELDKLKIEKAAKEADITAKTAEIATLTAAIATATGTSAAERVAKEAAVAAKTAAEAEVARLRAEVTRIQGRIDAEIPVLREGAAYWRAIAEERGLRLDDFRRYSGSAALLEQIDELGGELEGVTAERDRLVEQYNELREQAQAVYDRNGQLAVVIDQLTVEREALIRDLEANGEEREALGRRVEGLEREKGELADRVRALEGELAEAHAKSAGRAAALEAAQAESAGRTAELAAARTQIGELTTTLDAALEAAQAKLTARTAELSAAQAELAERTAELAAARTQIEELTAAHDVIQGQLTEANSQIRIKTAANVRAVEDLRAVRQQLRTAGDSLAQKNAELVAKTAEIEEVRREAAAATAAASAAAAEALATARAASDNSAQKATALATAQASIRELQELLDANIIADRVLADAAESNATRIAALEGDLVARQRRIEELTAELGTLRETTSARATQLEGELTAARAAAAECQAVLGRLRTKLADVTADATDLSKSLEILEAENKQLLADATKRQEAGRGAKEALQLSMREQLAHQLADFQMRLSELEAEHRGQLEERDRAHADALAAANAAAETIANARKEAATAQQGAATALARAEAATRELATAREEAVSARAAAQAATADAAAAREAQQRAAAQALTEQKEQARVAAEARAAAAEARIATAEARAAAAAAAQTAAETSAREASERADRLVREAEQARSARDQALITAATKTQEALDAVASADAANTRAAEADARAGAATTSSAVAEAARVAAEVARSEAVSALETATVRIAAAEAATANLQASIFGIKRNAASAADGKILKIMQGARAHIQEANTERNAALRNSGRANEARARVTTELEKVRYDLERLGSALQISQEAIAAAEARTAAATSEKESITRRTAADIQAKDTQLLKCNEELERLRSTNRDVREELDTLRRRCDEEAATARRQLEEAAAALREQVAEHATQIAAAKAQATAADARAVAANSKKNANSRETATIRDALEEAKRAAIAEAEARAAQEIERVREESLARERGAQASFAEERGRLEGNLREAQASFAEARGRLEDNLRDERLRAESDAATAKSTIETLRLAHKEEIATKASELVRCHEDLRRQEAAAATNVQSLEALTQRLSATTTEVEELRAQSAIQVAKIAEQEAKVAEVKAKSTDMIRIRADHDALSNALDAIGKALQIKGAASIDDHRDAILGKIRTLCTGAGGAGGASADSGVIKDNLTTIANAIGIPDADGKSAEELAAIINDSVTEVLKGKSKNLATTLFLLNTKLSALADQLVEFQRDAPGDGIRIVPVDDIADKPIVLMDGVIHALSELKKTGVISRKIPFKPIPATWAGGAVRTSLKKLRRANKNAQTGTTRKYNKRQ